MIAKLGFEVAQSSITKIHGRAPPTASLGWQTFLRNLASEIVAMDLFKYVRI
jgi:hypothetical protein